MKQLIREWYEEWIEYILSYSDHSRYKLQEWYAISSNENMLPEFMLKYKDKIKYGWYHLGSNPNLTIDFILKHISMPWDWQKISGNSVITPKIIEKYPDLPWNWAYMSQNESIYSDPEFISKHLSKLNMTVIVKKMPLSFLLSNHIDYFCETIFWKYIWINPSITHDFFFANLSQNLNWEFVSYNIFFTLDFIDEFIEFPWDWEILSSRTTPEFFEKYRNRDWDWRRLSYNPAMMSYIIENPDMQWAWLFVSGNKGLTIDRVKKLSYLNKPLDWGLISKNDGITLDDIIKNLHLPWSWRDISSNKHLTIEFVKKTSFQPFSRLRLSSNSMKFSRENYLSNKLKKMKEKMHEELMEITWHPDRLDWVLDNEQKERYS
jgi:hypothetical protein